MEVRRFDKERDYKTVAHWWANYKGWGAVVPIEFLPEHGYIVDDVCAGFLYKTDSKFALLEWVIANPESDATTRSEALDQLIPAILREAKALGFGAVYSSTKHSKLIDRYIKHGFHIGDTGVTTGIWGV